MAHLNGHAWRHARTAFLAWAFWLLLSPALAASLALDAATTVAQAWPAVSLRFDEGHTLTVEQVLAEPQAFASPHSPAATLGVRKDVAWLRIPLERSPQAAAHWVLDIDYPALNRVDVHVLVNGRVTRHTVLGNQFAYSERPMASRSHALTLELPAGPGVELLLRVQTAGAMILPITLNTPRAFHERAQNEQMLQGVLAGLGLCLLVYSLWRSMTLRETLSLKYALQISGSLLFSLYQFGIGAQYLWRDVLWLERHAAGLFSLMALTGSFLFIEHVLARAPLGTAGRRYVSQRFSRLMKAGALGSVLLAAVYALDIIDTRAISIVVSVLGPVPALLGLPGALARARKRDPVGWSFLFAWAVYAMAAAVLIALINGKLPVNFWTLHSFEFGATVDMLLYLYVLSQGTKAVHNAARHATRERDAMRSLAHSDSLTGLTNRRGLTTELKVALLRSSPQRLVALYLLDLDGFKPVNDQHGHDVGDELLIAVARRLQAAVRGGDVVARLGGDEFVIMSSGLTQPAQADALAHKLLEAINAPFQLGPHTCHVSMTIGYALAPLDGTDAAALLKQADSAMYAGKQAGKGCARRSMPG
jgi:diguanylate cyclase (GGDEF)-like protein